MITATDLYPYSVTTSYFPLAFSASSGGKTIYCSHYGLAALPQYHDFTAILAVYLLEHCKFVAFGWPFVFFFILKKALGVSF